MNYSVSYLGSRLKDTNYLIKYNSFKIIARSQSRRSNSIYFPMRGHRGGFIPAWYLWVARSLLCECYMLFTLCECCMMFTLCECYVLFTLCECYMLFALCECYVLVGVASPYISSKVIQSFTLIVYIIFYINISIKSSTQYLVDVASETVSYLSSTDPWVRSVTPPVDSCNIATN